MSLLDSLRKTLTPEQLTQVTDALGDDFDYDLIPRSRLNKVIGQRNDLREAIKGNSQNPAATPSKTKPKAKKDEDDDDDDSAQSQAVDVATLKAQWEKEQGDKVAEVKMQYAALDKLRSAKAQDADLIYSLVDHTKLSVNEKGELVGLDDQIKALQASKPFLFTEVAAGGKGGAGAAGAGAGASSGAAAPAGTGKGGVGDDQAALQRQDEEINQVFARMGIDMTDGASK